jgi:predicted transcriptional regulator
MKNTKVHFYQAFDATVKRFNLDINEVSSSSGIPVSKLVLFRGGFDTKIDTVENLLAALPVEARTYLMELMVNPESTFQSNRFDVLQAV